MNTPTFRKHPDGGKVRRMRNAEIANFEESDDRQIRYVLLADANKVNDLLSSAFSGMENGKAKFYTDLKQAKLYDGPGEVLMDIKKLYANGHLDGYDYRMSSVIWKKN